MGSEQVWTLTHHGVVHRVVASGSTRHTVEWWADGERRGTRTTLDDKVTVSPAGDPHRVVVRFSTMGAPRRATLVAGCDDVDLVPEPGSPAAAYEARVLEHPERHALLAGLGGVAKVVVPILLSLVVARLAVQVPWPDLPSIPFPDLPSVPWPDLPSVPWPDLPSIPLPDLPDVSVPGWVERVLDVATYVWPVVLAYALARAEIRRRRRERDRRLGRTEGPTQDGDGSGTD